MQGLSPELRRDLVLSLKTSQAGRPLSPLEVAEALRVAVDEGASFSEIATALGFESTSTLREIHRLTRLSKDLRHLVGWGRKAQAPLSMTAASQLARLDTPEHQALLAEGILAHRLTSTEARQVVETRIRSGKSIEDSIATVLKLRPRVVRRHVFIGAVTSDEARRELGSLSQGQRDRLLTRVLQSVLGPSVDWQGALGPEKFTLIGDAQLEKRMTELQDGFESSINSCLAEVMSLGDA